MTPRTRDEFLDLVDQLIFEIEEVVMCAGDEGDPEDSEFSDLLPVYELLSKDLKQLHADIMQGRHVFGENRDLPFMPLVNKWKARLPFHNLFATLNLANRQGLPG
ncbi:MAG: hypothetical protein OEY27_04300 [Gammaproteobacteria bacterium]|nr:hypothetical protein [Alphaproteobacteria bacterium]MDH5512417.1 hypothetical protein [Gammaproteobacteria bacterium]